MDKHSKKSSSLLHYPVLVVFSLFFLGLFALDLITPDRAYSEMENTTLSQRPALTQLSAKGLNSYFTAYTKYVKDQVFGRDEWISLQSVVETTLLQKEQNGGILLGKEHMMFPRTFGLLSSEERTLPKNTSAVESLCQRYPENVPVNAPLLDENTYLDQLSAAVQAAGGRFVDVRGTLTDHKGEYLYYRTDHHWTSLGAYYAYQQLCDALGLTPFDTAAHTALTADRFYGTHYSKTRTWNAEPDTITWYDLQNSLTVWNVTGPGQPTEGTTTGLYDLDKLKVGDYFTITVLRQTIFYQIDRIDIVEPEETGLLALDKEKDYCTLLTCTPYGINTKRLLVRGVRCEVTERAEPIRTGEKTYRRWYAAIGLNVFVAGMILCWKRKKKRRG